MNESKQYQTKDSYGPASDERGYAQSVMLQLLQIGELADLEQTESRKRSPIVRDAIDLYYGVSKSAKLQEMAALTQVSKIELVNRAIDQLYTKIVKTIQESE